jgi:hypothetical protein
MRRWSHVASSDDNTTNTNQDSISIPSWLTAEWVEDLLKADWLKRNLNTLKNLLTKPRATILGFILTWVVSSVLSVGEALVGSVNAVYDSLASVVEIFFDQVGTAGSVLLTGPMILLDTANTAIQSIAAASGPFAPVVIAVLWAVIVALIIYMVRNLPRVLWTIYQLVPGT